MYEKVDTCPCCNSIEFNNEIICDDYSVSQESFAIMKCMNCGFLVTSPRPNQSSIGNFYKSDNYISHTNKATNLTNFIYKIARRFTLKQKFNLVSKYAHKTKILDYGSGAGSLLHYFKEKGWSTYGVEPDEITRNKSVEDFHLEIYPSIHSLPTQKFAIISLWHVLEHIHYLEDTISQLYNSLSKKGKLIIAVPNHNSYDRQFYKKYWAAYDVPRHLYHFNQDTIQELMKYHNFELIETIPQKLDAYYVSLLSEKYKKGAFKFIKAFIIGWLSNRWAHKNNNNYSSLIYIFKKA